jgi:tetratricopeptide (TPR) repeat protein
MKVVGHTVQLLQSPCYQKTKTLTCMTCHNPHDRAPANNRTARHRQSCLNCHNSDACHESNASRQQTRQALVHLDQLTRLRRSPFDWELRALCLLQQRDLTATINALETAIGIDPNLLLARNLLAQLYEDQRQFELANTQKQIIRRLAQFLRQN